MKKSMLNLPSLIRSRARSGKKLTAVSAMTACALLTALSVQGATWNGSVDTSWSNASNWNENAVPGNGAGIDITNASAKNALKVVDGNTISTAAVALNSGASASMTGGTWSLSDRFRIGNVDNKPVSTFTMSGGTMTMTGNNGGFTIGANSQGILNISGTAKIVCNAEFFNIHGNTANVSAINQSGGTVFSNKDKFFIAEGGKADYNLTGGKLYASKAFLARNSYDDNSKSANSVANLNVSGGEAYVRSQLVVGSTQWAGKGTVTLTSGLLSAQEVLLASSTKGFINLKGGTFLAKSVNSNLTNAGSTIEITNNFNATQSAVEGLASGKTFFTANQDNTIGTMNVAGTYTQTAGQIVMDVSKTTADTLTASNFNITGGSLYFNLMETPTTDTVYNIFGDSPSGTIQFDSVTFSNNSVNWSFKNNTLAYRPTETFVWTGQTSTDWADASNWNKSGIPEVQDNVQIGTRHSSSYTNKAVIGEGDEAYWNLAYLNGGQLDIAGGTLYTKNRLRMGNDSNNVENLTSTLNFSSGTWIAEKNNGDGGIMMAASSVKGTYSEMNISGDAFFQNNAWFGIHGYSRGTINQTGGTVLNTSGAIVQFGEGDYEATYNLSGGTFYNQNKTNVGTNDSYKATKGNGIFNVSGTGELYVREELRLGRDNYGTGVLNISGGLVSAPWISQNNGTINLTGGTLVAQKITRSGLTNKGGTIEIASNFFTMDRYNAMEEGDNYFEKYQDGTVSTLDISGVFAQTSGRLIIDILQDENGAFSYDTIVADGYDITGGDLYLELLELPEPGTSFDLFTIDGEADWGKIDFENIFSSAEGPQAWVLTDGTLTYYTPDQVPEPSTLILLTLGAGMFAVLRRKNKKG